jgi:hypothetical protein
MGWHQNRSIAMNKLISALALTSLFAAAAVQAGPQYDRDRDFGRDWGRQGNINQRQDWQDRRIDRAFARGELSLREARRLDAEARRIARLEQQFRMDGRFSRYERQIVQRELDDLAWQINQATSNWRRG